MHRITVSQMRAAEKSHGDWKWATVALAFALMIFAFVQWRRPEAPSTNTTASMSDAALLSDVAYTVDEDIPDALEPANLLVNQMGGIDETTTTSQPTSRRRTSR